MTNEQLAEIQQYATIRNAPRSTMAHGVYPNCLKALAEYQALVDWLAVHPDWQQSHADMVAAVLPHVTALQQAMQTIVATMQAIETAAPGTFGIALPEEQPE